MVNNTFNNIIMAINVIIIFTLMDVQNKILSVGLSCVLALIVIYNIIMICYKVCKSSFFVQAIPCALCYLFMISRDTFHFNTFNHSFDITALVITLPILIAAFVCVVSIYLKIKSPFIMSLIVFVLIEVLIVGTVFLFNVTLSIKEPYIEEFVLEEVVDEYEASHPTSVSTKTFSVKAIGNNNALLEELVIKQSLEPNESDIFEVQIWPGLFADTYKVIGKRINMGT